MPSLAYKNSIIAMANQGSIIGSTTELQSEPNVALIQMPQTNMSKRPANNVDMMMSFNEPLVYFS
jgi:hypothetical protein